PAIAGRGVSPVYARSKKVIGRSFSSSRAGRVEKRCGSLKDAGSYSPPELIRLFIFSKLII
ncbi:hypothetical protein, partial [Klebsiella pneumoniae]|uniref:hypothetical protein n=1 Tax=Klebsiella pneumoniae TaxID=573 RepID=UPI001D0CF92F